MEVIEVIEMLNTVDIKKIWVIVLKLCRRSSNMNCATKLHILHQTIFSESYKKQIFFWNEVKIVGLFAKGCLQI